MDKTTKSAIAEIKKAQELEDKKYRQNKWNEKLEELVIEIGLNGGRFVGEGNLVFRPTLEYYVTKLEELFETKE